MGLKMKLRVISDIHNEFRADPVQIPVLEKEKEQIDRPFQVRPLCDQNQT